MNKGKKSSKIITVVLSVLTAIIAVLAAAIIINMIVCRVKQKPVTFFGTAFAIVQTDSMEPKIMTGDLIVYRSCKYADIEVGDVIVFVAGNGFSESVRGKSIVHEAIEITADGIRTKGVHNAGADTDLVTEANLLGICTGNSAFWGDVFTFLNKYGIFLIIAVIALPFIIKQIIKIVKLSKNGEPAVGGAMPEADEAVNAETNENGAYDSSNSVSEEVLDNDNSANNDGFKK